MALSTACRGSSPSSGATFSRPPPWRLRMAASSQSMSCVIPTNSGTWLTPCIDDLGWPLSGCQALLPDLGLNNRTRDLLGKLGRRGPIQRRLVDAQRDYAMQAGPQQKRQAFGIVGDAPWSRWNFTDKLDGTYQERTAEAGDARIVEPGYDTALKQDLVVARMFKAEAHTRHGPG